MPDDAPRLPPPRIDDRRLLAERGLLGLLLGGIAVGCAWVLWPFVSALLWAAILVFSTWPVFEWLRVRARLPRGLAAAAMVLLTAVCIVLPLAAAAPSSASDVAYLRGVIGRYVEAGLPAAPDWVRRVPLAGTHIADFWDSATTDFSVVGDAVRPYAGAMAEQGLNLVLGVAGSVASFLLALFIAFFFYLQGEPVARAVRGGLVRIAGPEADRLIRVTGATVRGTVYGILGTVIVQGILTGLAFWVLGVPRPVLLGAVAGSLSVLPIGAPVIWIPAGLWLLGNGRTFAGVALLIYGLVFISGSDNVIRPYFIMREGKLPFLVTVLGVLGGALAFGLIGVFLGPVLLGIGFTLVGEFARDADLA